MNEGITNNEIPAFNKQSCKDGCNCIEIAEAKNGGEPVKNYPCLSHEFDSLLSEGKVIVVGGEPPSMIRELRKIKYEAMSNNLPPGVTENMIPGNRPEDVIYERLFDRLPEHIQKEIESGTDKGKSIDEFFQEMIGLLYGEDQLIRDVVSYSTFDNEKRIERKLENPVPVREFCRPRIPEEQVKLCLDLFDKEEAAERILKYINDTINDFEMQYVQGLRHLIPSCPECEGGGETIIDGHAMLCKSCNGTGKDTRKL